MSHQEESHSTPALIQASDRLDADTGDPSSSLSSIPENNLLESYTRLSISLEDNGLFKVTEVNLDFCIYIVCQASYSILLDKSKFRNVMWNEIVPQVHERQAARMKTRSEWFLSPSTCPKMPAVDIDDMSSPYFILREEAAAANCYSGSLLIYSANFANLSVGQLQEKF